MAYKYNLSHILEQFNKIHNFKYDYSLVDYKGDKIKVSICCSYHGVFNQQPNAHKNGQGCPKCALINMNNHLRLGKDKFINKVNLIHPNKFSFEKTQYQGAHKKLIVTCINCKKDNIVSPSDLYKIKGCNFCLPKKSKPKISISEFQTRSRNIHNEKYDYSLINNINNQYDKVDIICLKHGVFKQCVSDHLQGCGCPKCSTSKGENDIINILNNKNIKYFHQYKVIINNSYHYFDFYLPDHKIIIEFNGKQHYEPIKFFGGDIGFNTLKIRDNVKKQYCLDNKIELRIIKYDEEINLSFLK